MHVSVGNEPGKQHALKDKQQVFLGLGRERATPRAIRSIVLSCFASGAGPEPNRYLPEQCGGHHRCCWKCQSARQSALADSVWHSCQCNSRRLKSGSQSQSHRQILDDRQRLKPAGAGSFRMCVKGTVVLGTKRPCGSRCIGALICVPDRRGVRALAKRRARLSSKACSMSPRAGPS